MTFLMRWTASHHALSKKKPDVTALCTLVLRGLPILLGDDPSNFYNTAFPIGSVRSNRLATPEKTGDNHSSQVTLLRNAADDSRNDSNDNEGWAQVTVGLLTVSGEDAPVSSSHLHLNPLSTAIILEGGIVMENLTNLPQALGLLFGLSYALHLEYPRAMRNTLNFIQRVMLRLGENKLPPRLQTLKNLLFS